MTQNNREDFKDNLIYNKPINLKNTLGFAIPTAIKLVFISLYTIIDGIVVSNFVGSSGLAAINIVYPVLNVCMAVSFMFAMGSTALIGKFLGEGKEEEANRFMTAILMINVVATTLMVVIFMFLEDKIFLFLGADEALLPYCREYGTIIVLVGPIWVMQILFQSFLVTADRARLSLVLSIAGGICNVVLDLILVGYFKMGLTGAALASVIGILIGGIVPIFTFVKKSSLLHFARPKCTWQNFLHTLGNGSSEMVVNLSSAITTTLFNVQTMALAGEKGVAAISAILYIQFLFIATIIGFSSGVGPLFSYNYGAGNTKNIGKLFKLTLGTVLVFSAALTLLAEIFSGAIALIFASQDLILSNLIVAGFRIIALSVLFGGVNIFASGFFTSLQNGKISALISFLRTLVIQVAALLILPKFMGINGVWWALPISEILAFILSIYMLAKSTRPYLITLKEENTQEN